MEVPYVFTDEVCLFDPGTSYGAHGQPQSQVLEATCTGLNFWDNIFNDSILLLKNSDG